MFKVKRFRTPWGKTMEVACHKCKRCKVRLACPEFHGHRFGHLHKPVVRKKATASARG